MTGWTPLAGYPGIEIKEDLNPPEARWSDTHEPVDQLTLIDFTTLMARQAELRRMALPMDDDYTSRYRRAPDPIDGPEPTYRVVHSRGSDFPKMAQLSFTGEPQIEQEKIEAHATVRFSFACVVCHSIVSGEMPMGMGNRIMVGQHCTGCRASYTVELTGPPQHELLVKESIG